MRRATGFETQDALGSKIETLCVPTNTLFSTHLMLKTYNEPLILNKCYDMRFAELSTVLTQQGADILTYPSAFTVPTGMAHWEVCDQCTLLLILNIKKNFLKIYGTI